MIWHVQLHVPVYIQNPAQRWIAFQDIGPSPSGRFRHAIACDGTRVFVLGGKLSPGAQEDETKLIHILDTSMLIAFFHFIRTIPKFENTEHLDYPEPDSGVLNPSEKAASGKTSVATETLAATRLSNSEISELMPQ